MRNKRFTRAILGIAACTLVAQQGALAQGFPNRPIKVGVISAPGVASDTIMRIVAQDLTEQMKVPIIIENRPGANGSLVSEAVAKSPPDGYSLVLGTISTHALNSALFPNLPYDPVRDFEAVAFVTYNPSVIVANAREPFRSFAELIAYARTHPGKVSYGTSNSTTLLAGETIKAMAGINMVAVPYKTTQQAVTDVVSGQIAVIIAEALLVNPHVKSGKLNVLASNSASPAALYPNAPPVAATFPGFHLSAWFGLFAPAGTPQPILNVLAAEVQRSLQKPATRARLEQLGFEMASMTRAEFGAFVRAEKERWGKRIKELGIEAQ
ncbi:MAG: Bug family tripartite tricarboxylate transporter substrate binding protein [Burkholderiales bacterium]